MERRGKKSKTVSCGSIKTVKNKNNARSHAKILLPFIGLSRSPLFSGETLFIRHKARATNK